MGMRAWSWSGTNGGTIEVGFDDKHFALEEMQTEISAMGQAHPTLPDEVPKGTVFTFSTEKSTGHLLARFRVGDTVYRKVAQGSVHQLWDTVHLIDQLLHPERYNKLAS